VFAARGGFASPGWGAQGLALPDTCSGNSGGGSGGGSGDSIAVTFNVQATTQFGENIFLTGSVPELQNWSPDTALALSAANYPTWSITVDLPADTAIQYKYIRKFNGVVTWE